MANNFKIVLDAIINDKNLQGDLKKVQNLAKNNPLKFTPVIEWDQLVSGKDSKNIEKYASDLANTFNKQFGTKLDGSDITKVIQKSLSEEIKNFNDITKQFNSKEIEAQVNSISAAFNKLDLSKFPTGTDIGKKVADVTTNFATLTNTINSGSSTRAQVISDFEKLASSIDLAKNELKILSSADNKSIRNIVQKIDTQKIEAQIRGLENSYKKLDLSQIDSGIANNIKQNIESARPMLAQLRSDIEKNADPKQIIGSWNKLDAAIRTASNGMKGLPTEKVSVLEGALAKSASRITGLIGTFFSFSKVISYIREGVTALKDFDSALTNISYTMDINNTQLQELGDNIINIAKEMKTSIQDAASVAQIYANMNTSVEELQNLSRPTLVLSNLTGMDASTAADDIQAVVQQFGIAAEESEHIVDVFDYISRNIAVDYSKGVQGMAEAVEVAGASAKMAGLSYEQLSAIIGKTMETTRQSGSQIGNALKTITVRLSKAKELEDDLDPKSLSDAAEALDRIGIQVYDSAGNFNKFDNIMGSLAAKWNTLTDAEKANISYAIAATRQSNTLGIILANWTKSMDMATEATVTQGNAMENQAKYEESYAAKLKELSTEWQSLLMRFLDTGALETVTEILSKVLSLIEGIQNTLGNKALVGGGLAALLGFDILKMTGKNLGHTTLIGTLFDPKTWTTLGSKIGEATGKLKGFTSIFSSAANNPVAAGAAGAGGTAGTALGILGMGTVLAGLSYAAVQFSQVEGEMRKKARAATDELNINTTSLSNNKARIEALNDVLKSNSSSLEEITSARQELSGIQDTLLEQYGKEPGAIQEITKAINGEADAFERLNKIEWDKTRQKYNKNEGIDGFFANLTNFSNRDLNNVEAAKRKYSSYEQKLNISPFFDFNNKEEKAEYDALIELIKNKYGGEFAEGELNLSITGNATDIYNDLIELKNQFADNKELSNYFDSIAGKALDAIDAYKEIYNKSVFEDDISKNFKEQYDAVADAYKKYTEAIGSEDMSTPEGKNKAKEAALSYINAFNNALQAAKNDTDATNFFEDLFPKVDLSQFDIIPGDQMNILREKLGDIVDTLAPDKLIELAGMNSGQLDALGRKLDKNSEEIITAREESFRKAAERADFTSGAELIERGLITSLEDAQDNLDYEYQKIDDWGLSEFAKRIKDNTIQSQFGNIDMDNRPFIQWSEELRNQYSDVLSTWLKEGQTLSEEFADGMYDTVRGESSRFGESIDGIGWEIAFSPIMPNGQPVSKDTVNEYFNSLISDILASGGTVNTDSLAAADLQGKQIGETYVQGIFAAADKTLDEDKNWAATVGKLMHFAGDFGAIELGQNVVKAYQDQGTTDAKIYAEAAQEELSKYDLPWLGLTPKKETPKYQSLSPTLDNIINEKNDAERAKESQAQSEKRERTWLSNEIPQLQTAEEIAAKRAADEKTITEELSKQAALNIKPVEFNYDKFSDGFKMFSAVTQAYQDFEKDLSDNPAKVVVDGSDLDKIKKDLSDSDGKLKISEQAWNDFAQAVGSADTSKEEKIAAFATLAEKATYASTMLDGLTTANKAYYTSQIESQGVTNASAIVTDELAAASEKAAQGGVALSQVTWQSIEALTKEGLITAEDANALVQYMFQKNAASGLGIDASGAIADLDAEQQKLLQSIGLLQEYQRQHTAAMISSGEYNVNGGAPSGINVKAWNEKQEKAHQQQKLKDSLLELKKLGGGGSKGGGGGGNSKSDDKDEYLEQYKKDLEQLKKVHDSGKINEKKYYEYCLALAKKYFKGKKKYLKEYAEAEKTYLTNMKSLYDSVMSGMTSKLDRQIDQLNKAKDEAVNSLNAQKDAAVKALEKERDKKIKAIEKQIEGINEEIDAKEKQIKLYEDEIDAINEANEARDRSLKLQEAEYNLERKMHQNTKQVKLCLCA